MARLGRGRSRRLVLDIGSSAIRLCELAQTKDGYQLTRYLQRELDHDPSLTEEERHQRTAETLKNLLKEAKIRSRRTILAVPGRSVFTRCRTLPPVPEYKVTQIVRYEIQQQIPFALDQIALDYQILQRTEAGGYDVMMAAIKVDVVEKHLEALKDAKARVDTVDVCSLASYNWLKQVGELGQQEDECVALIDLGAATTEIVIERANQFRFTRPINIGGKDITAAISEAFNIDFAEAEKLKRERAFAPTGDPKRDGQGAEVIGNILQRLVGEITRSFSYFRSLPGGGTVNRVVLVGGGACLRNIVPYLRRQLNMDVRVAQPLAGLAIAPGAQQVGEHPEQACVALGLALRNCQPVPIGINLIPPRILLTARRREQTLYWVLSFLVLAVIAASVIPARANKDKLVREQIEILKRYITAYEPRDSASTDSGSMHESELSQVRREVQDRLNELNMLTNAARGSVFWLEPLRLLTELRPEGGTIWLSSFETTVVKPSNDNSGGDGNQRRPQPAGGGAGPSPNRRAFASEGFPGIVPGKGAVAAGTDRPRRGSPAAQNQPASTAAAPETPNGFRIIGYAQSPEALREYVDRLKLSEPFKDTVILEEADVRRVPANKMYQAYVAKPSLAGSGGGSSTSRGAGDGGLAFDQRVETVVEFEMNLVLKRYRTAVFGAPAAAPAPSPGPGGPGGPGAGGPGGPGGPGAGGPGGPGAGGPGGPPSRPGGGNNQPPGGGPGSRS